MIFILSARARVVMLGVVCTSGVILFMVPRDRQPAASYPNMADEPPPLDFSDEDNTPVPEEQDKSELNYTPFRDPVEEPPPVEEQPKQEEKDSQEGELVGVVGLLFSKTAKS